MNRLDKYDLIDAYCETVECGDCELLDYCKDVIGYFDLYDDEKLDEVISKIPEFETPKQDNVNHPKHYNMGKYECIDVMEDVFGKVKLAEFCVMNAFKYIYRYKHKNKDEDIRKAIWYLQKHVELLSDDE